MQTALGIFAVIGAVGVIIGLYEAGKYAVKGAVSAYRAGAADAKKVIAIVKADAEKAVSGIRDEYQRLRGSEIEIAVEWKERAKAVESRVLRIETLLQDELAAKEAALKSAAGAVDKAGEAIEKAL